MTAIDTAIRAAAADIELIGVTKAYDAKTVVIPQLDVALRPGEFTVVLGPSGCGKSTLLQMIAGLERVSGGKILIGGREVQNLEPKHRGCAMVFQNYALYPHMTVAENMAYSLKVAGVSKAERAERVATVAKMLGLADFLARKPGQLSGGQRQRVAIGRAIIREPGVLLFDEPLSNLDAQLRHDMRVELADLHRRIGATSVFVTHDQVEAMTLADRILVLNKGHIEQFDTPKAIYHHPASIFVAKFIGSPPMNILAVTGDGSALRLADGQVVANFAGKGSFQLGIRPEDITVKAGGPIKAQIRYREDLGSHEILEADIAGQPLRIATPYGAEIDPTSTLSLSFSQARLHLFENETGRAISNAFDQTKSAPASVKEYQ
ncbi:MULTISPECIES: sn-glycerol-3-phosphate ABC transporter ATP-binding protein UgpC [unclassified Ensifer]|uniref:ABC transporter ATP-binding protein n=1 Tax=unclassified Ensifer TaxID=2633371 RepID=UPI0008133EEA|nr:MULTISPECIES: sn-glycerol-3-phosphate ABC transporter ATP-binding protein UgpC [unclassified Ensifer]OCP19914.1 sn-glycerol-3-phosphate ABC transporter ATP-binding protein UgpC [Ensifer sp. LC54]OCP21098.1 sn-glycerol-3-phosphate ABC transporter ATP-binding protein UgpC [Ensifer sp. LC384]